MIGMLALLTLVEPALSDPPFANDLALTVYGGRMTDSSFGETLSTDVEFIDTYIAVVALAWTAAHFLDDALTLEVEGQVGKYFGDQDNLEFNLPVAGRWRNFPWDSVVDTSFAYGVGLSYATEEPEAEKMIHEGTTSRLMGYWFGEITLGPPGRNWAVALRLHHRSPAFGLFAASGGSNTFAAGLKVRF